MSNVWVKLYEDPEDVDLRPISPEEAGILTDGPIWTDGSFLYWHERYAIEDYREQLEKEGCFTVLRVPLEDEYGL